MPDRDDHSAGAGDRTFPEAVHQTVADQPADELKAEQRDVAERRDGAGGAKAVAQVQRRPRAPGVLDGGAGDRDDHQRASAA